MSLKKSNGSAVAAGISGVEISDRGDSLQLAYPRLTEFLTATRWEDGSERQTSTLMVLWEDGRWKGCLHDRAEERSGWISSRTWGDLLAALETALVEEDLDWRRRKGPRR